MSHDINGIIGPRFLLVALSVLALAACSSPISVSATPALTQVFAKFSFDIIDGQTGQPVTANVSIRREQLDGTLVDEYPLYTGQHIDLEAPTDPNLKVFILVEAAGYQDWEMGMVVKQAGTLSGPIRLRPLTPSATPTPVGVQG